MLINFSSVVLNVEIAAQEIFSFNGISITNAMFTGCISLLIVFGVLLYVSSKIRNNQYNRFVGLVQWVFNGLVNSIEDIIPDKILARKITPLAITIFFYVLFNYWFSVVPGLESIHIGHIPLLRSMTADLNFTVALAIVTMVAVQFYAIKSLGLFENAKRYFRNPIKDPLGSFEGILELAGELSRGIALALRLFGNAFAGEVLLAVITVLAGYFASFVLPIFMIFELFIGFIQAYVFFMLTLIFTSLAVAHTSSDSHANHSVPVTNMVKKLE